MQLQLHTQLDFRDKHDLSFFNAFMAGRSYVNDAAFSSADMDLWNQWQEQEGNNTAERYPHAYRWYVHISALMRLQNTEQASLVSFLPTGSRTTATTTNNYNDRKRRHSGESSSLAQLKKEASERAVQKASVTVLFTIQITPHTNSELHDARRLWEKLIQTTLPEEIEMKWGEFCTWIPDTSQPSRKVLQTTFVSRIPSGDFGVLTTEW